MRLGVLVIIAILAAPPLANAATVRAPNRFVHYDAAAGEANHVTITGSLGSVVITDTGANITPGQGCAAVNEHEVKCIFDDPRSSGPYMQVHLGDRRDWLSFSGTGQRDVWGESGSDVLLSDECGFTCGYIFGGSGGDSIEASGWVEGNTGDDVLTGSAEADRLRGGWGDDVVRAGEGDDDIEPSRGNDDVFGGPGNDKLKFAPFGAGVRADMSTGRASGQGKDTFQEIERLAGTWNADELIGDASANALIGREGADIIFGRGGSDRIFGNTGRDKVYGEAGDDTLEGGASPDFLVGGKGDDVFRARDGRVDYLYGGDDFDRAQIDENLDVSRAVEEFFA
jgi:Ca2+-binding RTX toxin-like protein